MSTLTEIKNDRALLAALFAVAAVLDAEGEEAVSWYEDGMGHREIIENLLSDPEKRAERCALLVCTLKHM